MSTVPRVPRQYTCSVCGKVGHRVDNKDYPECRAVWLSRSSKPDNIGPVAAHVTVQPIALEPAAGVAHAKAQSGNGRDVRMHSQYRGDNGYLTNHVTKYRRAGGRTGTDVKSVTPSSRGPTVLDRARPVAEVPHVPDLVYDTLSDHLDDETVAKDTAHAGAAEDGAQEAELRGLIPNISELTEERAQLVQSEEMAPWMESAAQNGSDRTAGAGGDEHSAWVFDPYLLCYRQSVALEDSAKPNWINAFQLECPERAVDDRARPAQ